LADFPATVLPAGTQDADPGVDVFSHAIEEIPMWAQTLTPNGRSLVVEVPEELANQPIRVVLIPSRISTDLETRRRQLHAFFAQYQADAGLLKYGREELYER
jgi:hypothetical protein